MYRGLKPLKLARKVQAVISRLVENWRIRVMWLFRKKYFRLKELTAEVLIQAKKFARAFLTVRVNRTQNERSNVMAKKWYDEIKEAIKDIATLDVVTTTGSIQFAANELVNVDWEKMAEAVSKKIKAADINVVAFTHSQWDCDSFIFVKTPLSEEEQKLVESHAAVVDAAHATRREAVKMLAEVVKPGG
jgi:hypothetical protein